MPLKQDRTSYTISNNLKTSMPAKGYDVSVKEGNTYYDGSNAEIHLALFMLPNGKFRTVVESSDSTFDVTTWTHTIVYNGQSKTGTDTKKVDAIAKALKKLIDDL